MALREQDGSSRSLRAREDAGRRRLWLTLALITALALAMGLAVSAQAETLPVGTVTAASAPAGPAKTHTNADYPGAAAAPFSVGCNGCHAPHKTAYAHLLQTDGAAANCALCHDSATLHGDPATKLAVSALPAPVDCLTCHPHSAGFMPVAGATSLILEKKVTGYDDLDASGNLSPGDRVHYRIDYSNPGPEDASGVALRDEPDMAHVATVEQISTGGTFDGAALTWSIGALTAGASAFVTYDVTLQGAAAFSGGGTTLTTTATSTTDTTATTATSTTGTTATTATSTTDTAATTATTATTDTSVATSTTDTTATTTTTTTDATTSSSTSDTIGTTSTTAPSAVEPGTTSTLPSAAAPANLDVTNNAVLSADNRVPVTTSVTISVVVGGPLSPLGSSAPTTDSTTTTSVPVTDSTTTTTVPATTASANPLDPLTSVVNTAVLSADNRDPVSAQSVVTLVEPGQTTIASALRMASSSSTVMAADPAALTLSSSVAGYDDLDASGDLSPGDRVHYRIDYANPGPDEVTGTVVREQLDAAHIASVEAISDSGSLEKIAAVIPSAIEWKLGTLAAGSAGFVTYDAALWGPLVAVREGWYFPVQGPNQYSDDFGAPRYAGGFHTHQGNDIMCERGTPLVAVVSGVISRTDPTDTGLGGINLSLHGDDGNSYYYAHLCAIQDGIVPGVRVVAGQVVGFAGDTGDAKGGPVHLHFEIHPGGGPAVDPYLVLQGVLLPSEVPTTTSETTTTTTVPLTDTTTTTVMTPVSDTTTTTVMTPVSDTTTTALPTTDTTPTTAVPTTDTTPTTAPPTTDTTPTTAPPAPDTTTTVSPPTTDTTTTTAPSAPTTTTAPLVATVLIPVGAGFGPFLSIRRRRR